jgi:VCBS repeat-containing protein
MKRRLPKQGTNFRRLGLERLESRVVLDGNVHAFVSGGNLHIDGDSQNNAITITQSATGSFTITSGISATTINGQAGPVTLDGVRKNVILNMKDGDDTVEFDGTTDQITIRGRLIADMASGNDQLMMENVHLRGMTINMGTGDDTLNFGSDGSSDGVTSSKLANINMGPGTDDARIANSNFRQLLLNMGSGNDTMTIQGVTVHKRSIVDGGPGTDTLNRQNNHGKIKYLNFETVNNTVTSPSPIPPVANNDTASVTRSQSTSINVATNDTATSGQTINDASIAITQQPAHGTAMANSNGTVTYTNNGATAGTDSFQYTIKDSAGTTSNPATVSITVNPPVTAVNDAASILNNANPNTITGNVLTNDTGGTGTKTVSAVNSSAANVGTNVTGQFGTFNISSGGAFTYTLNESNAQVSGLATGATLTDSVTYTAKDSDGSTSTATLTVTITGH